MRVSTNMIYTQAVTGMNDRLAELMRLNGQSASQRQVERPSDDPAGMARALDLRTTLSETEQYQDNIDTAEAWLTMADDELQQASEVIIRLKEICNQASTGTYDGDQREMIAAEARGLMEELVDIANTEYAGDALFAGSRTDVSTYSLGLGATVREGDGSTPASLDVTQVVGGSTDTTYIEFIDAGTVGTDPLRYRYTTDGGDNWTEATLAAGDTTLQAGGVEAALAPGGTVTPPSEQGKGDGTTLWLRPAATYHGNTTDQLNVVSLHASPVTASADGAFASNIQVRVDSPGTLPGPIEYSYSQDGGSTWASGNVTSNATFYLPGGQVALASNGGNTLATGDQFLVQPENGALFLDIGPTSTIQINNIGADIFGGLSDPTNTGTPQVIEPADENLFETVGALVGYLETNDQQGIGDSLDALDAAHARLTVALGDIGGREARLEYARTSADVTQESATTHISSIEDADVTQLSIDLARAEYAYQAVLQSSSNIMQLSLLNYL